VPDTREAHSRSARIRAQLDHPVIDGDGHIVELMPVFLAYVRDNGYGGLVRDTLDRKRAIEDLSMDERRQVAEPRLGSGDAHVSAQGLRDLQAT